MQGLGVPGWSCSQPRVTGIRRDSETVNGTPESVRLGFSTQSLCALPHHDPMVGRKSLGLCRSDLPPSVPSLLEFSRSLSSPFLLEKDSLEMHIYAKPTVTPHPRANDSF